MRKPILIAVCLLLALPVERAFARLVSECPVTQAAPEWPGPPLPGSQNVYGNEALAVTVPANGIWPTTRVGARLAVKVFWWSTGYRPGMEANLRVEIRNLDGGPNDAVVSAPTSAHNEDSLGGWAMLTGINFPSAGCWEITGEYLGEVLTFVVATVDAETLRKNEKEGEQRRH